MKSKTYLFTFFLLFVLNSVATAQVFKNSDLTITQLEDQMWVIETTDNTTMYIIEGEDKAMLVDTGTKCERLDEVVRQITQKPLYVVVTHVHVDHAGNIGFFDDIYFHEADTVLMNRLSAPYEGSIHFIDEDDVFDLGGKQIVVSHMPGHTPGSIILLDYQSGNCFSGDAFGSGQVWLQLWPFSTIKTYANSCKKMEKIMDNGIDEIYCGHYPYVKTAYDKSYISEMRELAEALDNGTASEAKPYPNNNIDIACDKPKIVTKGKVSIVYDPEHIK